MTNYDKMWEILEQYHFEVEPNLTVVVRCTFCKNLLIDACQGPCGCLYCCHCIEKYLESGEKCCPGTNLACDSIRLDMETNITRDNNINHKISQLQTKCPSESCNFVNNLIEVCNHLQICEKVPTFCPYRSMGCLMKPMLIDKLAEHLQIEIYSHNKLLVKWITRMQSHTSSSNDEQIDKSMESQLESLFEKLSIVLSKKQLLFKNILNEMEELKTKTFEFAGMTKSLKEINERQSSEIALMKENNNKKVDQFHRETHMGIKNLKQQLKDHEASMKKRETEMLNLKLKVKKLEERSKRPGHSVKYSLEKIVKIASFRWSIDNVKEIRSDGEEMIYSDFFHTIDKDYRMRIWMYPNGNGVDLGDNITMQLLVWSNEAAACHGSFPFKADVSLSIKNALKPDKCCCITQLCLFEKPNIFLYSISDAFHFNYFQLNLAGVFQNNIVVIECALWIYK